MALNFALISAGILFIAFATIQITFNSFVKSDFYNRLTDRANVAAQLYLKADEISADSLNHVRDRYIRHLTNEVVRIYDERNTASFIRDRDQYWPVAVIKSVRRSHLLQFSEGQQQTVGIYYDDNQGKFVILVSAIDVQGRQRIHDLIEILAVLLIVVSAVLFFIGRLFAQKALEPIDGVIGEMKQVRASNLSMRISEGNGRDEISQLATNFNRLLSHLENAFELQQTFVTNASHELRTPVTSIIGEIEVSMRRNRSPEEYERVLESILSDAVSLNETITGLLELAQVDMNYTQAELSPVAIDEMIWELNDYWNQRMGKGMFSVTVLALPDDPEKLLVPANRALLLIALNNIIGNAYKFSSNKPVQCSLMANDESIIIRIIDQGIGINEAEKDKIFRSFYRGGNVKDFRGSGIGLYVTSKIVSLFNGRISVSSSGTGTAFTIEFLH